MRAEPLDRYLAIDRAAREEERRIDQRKALITKALWQGLHNREPLRERLRTNAGVWWEELAPLTARERIAVIAKLRETWRLAPDPRMKPAEGAPRVDAPHLGRPE